MRPEKINIQQRHELELELELHKLKPHNQSRRMSLKILAAGMSLGLGVYGIRQLAHPPTPVQWTGVALGAASRIALWHPDSQHARRVLSAIAGELERLENIFSLYRKLSEISQLNLKGFIQSPSEPLRTVLEQGIEMSFLSEGAFDPSIQPLWLAYRSASISSDGPAELHNFGHIRSLLPLIDYASIEVDRHVIRLKKKGMAISLNGIAQGYITDRISDILATEGFESALIELGEIRAIGGMPDGTAFPIHIVNPASPTTVNRIINLKNEAISVSGGYGTRIGINGDHHIFDPSTGQSADRLREVIVTAPKAILADALSTAIYVAGEDRAFNIIANYPSAVCSLMRKDGTIKIISN